LVEYFAGLKHLRRFYELVKADIEEVEKEGAD